MSYVTSVYIQTDCLEPGWAPGEEKVVAFSKAVKAKLTDLEPRFGDIKAPQVNAYGAGVNYLDLDTFYEALLAIEFEYPRTVVVITQTEDNDAIVWRPGDPNPIAEGKF